MSKSPVLSLPRLERAPLLSVASLMTLEPRYAFDASVSDLFDEDRASPHRWSDNAAATAPTSTRDTGADDDAARVPPVDIPSSARGAPPREVVFVDAGLPDLALLLAEVPSQADVVLVGRDESFARVAADVLSGASDIAAIHIIAHGGDGHVSIGSDGLDPLAAGAEHHAGLMAIGAALGRDGDLLIYGCDFARSETGHAAAAALARITGADIAASTDISGGGDVGGDFDLEHRVGIVETRGIAADGWNHVLAAPIVISPLGDQTRSDGQTVVIETAPCFQDPDGDSLTYSATGLPPMLTINASNGRILGTLPSDASDIGSYVVTVRATDPSGGFVEMTFNFAVTNVPPQTVDTTPNRSNVDGTNVGTIPFATYFRDGSPDFDALVYTATGLPPGLTIDATTGAVSGLLPANASQTNGGVYNVVITATDASGAQATQSFTWTIGNLPVVGTVPNQGWTDGQTVAFDLDQYILDQSPDSDPVTITLLNPGSLPPGLTFDPLTNRITGTVASNASATGTYVLQFTASDGNGSNITRSFTITVTNPTPESDPIPAQSGVEGNAFSLNAALYFRDGGTDTDALSYAVTGLPSGLSLDPLTGVISGTLAPGSKSGGVNGVYTINITVTDAQGATHSRAFTLTVVNDPPVTVGTPPNQSAHDGQALSMDFVGYFQDPDGDALTYTATGLPPGLSIDAATGRVTGTLSAAASQPVPYAVTITATDPAGQSASVQFTIAVSNLPVVQAGPVPDQTAIDGQSISLSLAAYFADQAPDADVLQYTVTGLPPGLTFNALTGIISGQLSRDASLGGPYTVGVTVTDGQGSTLVENFEFAVTNPPPNANPDTAATDEDVNVVIDVLGNDTDPDGDSLLVTLASASVGSVTILPDGRLSYSPPANYYGSAVITYTVRDANGATAQSTVTITINPLDDAPIATTPPDVTTQDGASVTIPLAGHFSDPDGGPLTYMITGLPPGLSYDPATGVITGALAAQASGPSPYMITVTATDTANASVTRSFALTVVNPPPELISPLPGWTQWDGDMVQIDLGAYVRDGGVDTDTLTFDATNLPPGLSINPVTGRISGTLPIATSGSHAVILTVTDAQGASYATTFTLTVLNPPPQVGVIAIDMGTAAEQVLDPLSYTTDPDGDALELVSASVDHGTVTLGPNGQIVYKPPYGMNGKATVTFTVRDADGATVTGRFEVTVRTPPEPFVLVRSSDAGAGEGMAGRHASGVVLAAVNGASDLGGVMDLGPLGDPALLARSLTPSGGEPGALSPEPRADARSPHLAWSRERIDWTLDEAQSSNMATPPRLIVEVSLMADRILVDLWVSEPGAVFEVVVQGKEGAALPAFVHGLAEGRLAIDRQAPGAKVTLEIVALTADGLLVTRTVTIDAGTGRIERPSTWAAPFGEAIRQAVGVR